ncbi:protein translocase subunit SecD [Caldisalinibacter kiritimatiensis]|uniref:Protein translocase subunit SecD n=1 Tax=Caldisalinibacter kiritimatiensis TaxID=1304284 RepID=R1CVJ3_9FIRM|nr:protein translocase subunit SecD [Caldisalinibacter kiritimatiensis]EOD00664.1 Protein-export membrane protein SecD [Caldisalinibacter kiritimatiensis]
MKAKHTIIFLAILLVVGVFSYSAIYGIDLGKYEVVPVKEELKLGLDLAGGVYVVLEAQTDATGAELEKLMEQTRAIIEQRVNGLGVTEPNITIEGKKRIRIELAGLENPQQAIEMIGKTAQLQFIDPEGNVVVTGKNVRKSEVAFQQNSLGKQVPVVSLEFDKEGTKKFADTTKRLITKQDAMERIIYIVLDEQVISSPAVNPNDGPITNGKAVIVGEFTLEEASNLANLIRAGALPVEMKEVETSVVGPTLGLESLNKSVYAAGIGLALIFLFMIIYYRIPGVIADIALTVYILIVLGTMIYLDARLTLPGIAGLILSIGMAVDANVVIFERIKEEIRVGKTLRASVDSGFKKALVTVLDANITTLIAGIVLFVAGTGPIRGFAVTLLIGLVASMVTAIFITRYMLKLVIGMNITKNTKLYGA